MPRLRARLPARATVARQIAGYWSGDHRSRRGDEDVQHCYSHSWRIALLERFWQARHPPRYAAYLTPSSPRFPLSSENVADDRYCIALKLVVLEGGHLTRRPLSFIVPQPNPRWAHSIFSRAAMLCSPEAPSQGDPLHQHQPKRLTPPTNRRVLACFDPPWPNLNLAVAYFEMSAFRVPYRGSVSLPKLCLSLIHISEPTRRTPISYAV